MACQARLARAPAANTPVPKAAGRGRSRVSRQAVLTPVNATNPATSSNAHARPVGCESTSSAPLSPNSTHAPAGAPVSRPIRSRLAVSAIPALIDRPLGFKLEARKIAVGVQAARIPTSDSQPPDGANNAAA